MAIPKNVKENPNCLFLHEDHPFHEKGSQETESGSCAQYHWTEPTGLAEIEEKEFEKDTKIKLLLFTTHRKAEHKVGIRRKNSEGFLEFKRRE